MFSMGMHIYLHEIFTSTSVIIIEFSPQDFLTGVMQTATVIFRIFLLKVELN